MGRVVLVVDSLKAYTRVQVVAILLGSLLGDFYVVFVANVSGSIATVGLLMVIKEVISGVLSVPFNFLGDKILGQKPFVIVENLLFAYIMYSYVSVTQTSQLYFLAVLSGIAMGMASAHGPWLAKLTEGAEKGKKLGWYNMATGVATAGAMAIGGFIIQYFSFAMLFYIGAIGAGIEAVMYMFVPESEGKMGLGKTFCVLLLVAAAGGYIYYTGRVDYLYNFMANIGHIAQRMAQGLGGLGLG